MENKEEIINNYIFEEILNRPNLLNEKLTYNNKKLNHRNSYYQIKNYLDDFIKCNPNNRFIVMPGLRGVGKTTIVYQIYEYLLKTKEIEQNRILYISGDIINSYFDLNILEIIEHYIKNIHNQTLMTLDKQLFVFIDESQYDNKWSLAGKIIFDKSNKVFMIFTVSSAVNLEINVDAARRALKVPLNPISFKEHLYLKYNFKTQENNPIKELIYTGEVKKAKEFENKINLDILNIKNYNINEWEDYLKFGAFPFSINETNHLITCNKLNEMINKVVETDLTNISEVSKVNASRILHFLALQKPNEISQNKIANFLNASSGSVNKIISILEKSHLIFHVEPYSSSSKRIRKSWKYYFKTPSLRHVLSLNIGNTNRDINSYLGVLVENLVASNLSNTYYDSKKGGVDFIISRNDKVIPVEVGYGKKSKKQIKKAISNYKSDYGIVISNTTGKIEKEDNIIYLPIKTFSFI